MMMLLWSSKYTEINATVTKGLDSGLLITFSLGDFEMFVPIVQILCDVLTSPYLFILLINSSSLSEVSAICIQNQ